MKQDFNNYGARHDNHDVMVRWHVYNVRIKSLMLPADGSPREGRLCFRAGAFGGQKMSSIFDAALQYMKDSTPTVVPLAGERMDGR
jgi:aconitase A